MHDVFISYAREDERRAEEFFRAISHSGWRVWWDRELVGGQTWRDEITSALDASDVVVVLWSEHSGKSNFVQDEADRAQQAGKLISVRIGSHDPPMGFRQQQVVDMSNWDGHDLKHPGLSKILTGITRKVRGGARLPEKAEAKERSGKYPGARVLSILAAAGVIIVGTVTGVWYYRGDGASSGADNGKASSSSSTAGDGGKVADSGKDAPGPPTDGKKSEPSKGATNGGGRSPGGGITPVSRTEKPKGTEPIVVPPPPAATSTGATAAAPTAERGCATLIAATRKRPDVAEGFFDLGKCHYAESRFNDSVIAYNSAIELNENLPKYYEARGLAKWKNDMATQGVNDLKSAIELKPTEASLYETRGQIYFAMRDYQRAQDDYDKATRLNPKSKRAWTGLADAAEKTGSDEIASAAKAQASALP